MVKPFTTEEVQDWKNFNAHIDYPMALKGFEGYLRADDPEMKQMFADILEAIRTQVSVLKSTVDRPFRPVPQATTENLDLNLGHYVQGGKVLEELPVRLRINDLIMSMMTAAPNQGKTRALIWLVFQIVKYNKTVPPQKRIQVLIFDQRNDFASMPVDKLAFYLERLPFNPWDGPFNVDAKKWMSTVSEIMMHSFKTYLPSKYRIFEAVWKKYQENKKAATFFDLLEELQIEKDSNPRMIFRNQEILEVNVDRVRNMLSQLGGCLKYSRSFPLWQFLDLNEEALPIVINVKASPDVFSFLVGWGIAYTMMFLDFNGIRGNLSSGGILILFDESNEIFPPSSQYSESRRELGASFTARAPLQCRDYSMCIMAASQRIMSADMVTACNLKMVGYLGDFSDMKAIANSMGDITLAKDVPRLKPQEFIIKIGSSEPSIIRIPDFEIRKRVTEEEAMELMKPYYDYIFDYCKEQVEEMEEPEQRTFYPRLNDYARAILQDVLVHPDRGITTRYRELKVPSNEQHDAREQLLNLGYCELVEDNLFGERISKYLTLSRLGWERLKNDGFDIKDATHSGRQTAKHSLIQNIAIHYLKKLGHNVLHDFKLGSKVLDAYSEGPDNTKTGYEVVTSPFIDKDRAADAINYLNSYIFVCDNRTLADQIEKQLFDVKTDKIEYVLVAEFLCNLRKRVFDLYSKKSKKIKENLKNETDSALHDENHNKEGKP